MQKIAEKWEIKGIEGLELNEVNQSPNIPITNKDINNPYYIRIPSKLDSLGVKLTGIAKRNEVL